MEILRENIKTLLKLYTQQELTNLAGNKDRTTFSSFISNKSNSINLKTILCIAKKLDISIDDLCNKKLKIKFVFEDVE